ncbi:MAG TPA: hypothetical protein VMF67_01330, partial [Rhizomicrobium sp.]|nr:hypothetical protein [Rhizomicrobium sp.]
SRISCLSGVALIVVHGACQAMAKLGRDCPDRRLAPSRNYRCGRIRRIFVIAFYRSYGRVRVRSLRGTSQ